MCLSVCKGLFTQQVQIWLIATCSVTSLTDCSVCCMLAHYKNEATPHPHRPPNTHTHTHTKLHSTELICYAFFFCASLLIFFLLFVFFCFCLAEHCNGCTHCSQCPNCIIYRHTVQQLWQSRTALWRIRPHLYQVHSWISGLGKSGWISMVSFEIEFVKNFFECKLHPPRPMEKIKCTFINTKSRWAWLQPFLMALPCFAWHVGILLVMLTKPYCYFEECIL